MCGHDHWTAAALLVTLKAFVTADAVMGQRPLVARSPCGSVARPCARHSGWIARDASSSMRLCTHARIIVSHLSLSLSVHCACFVATCLRPALAACNYFVLRYAESRVPTSPGRMKSASVVQAGLGP